VTEPVAWENGRRADVQLGALSLTLFTKAIYEDACELRQGSDGLLASVVAIAYVVLAGAVAGVEHDVVGPLDARVLSGGVADGDGGHQRQ